MKNRIQTVVAVISLLIAPDVCLALPILQLDASPGTYDVSGTTESTIASGNSFTLFALYDASDSNKPLPSGTFYVSAAIVPKIGPAVVSFGSFTVDSTTFTSSAGGNMQYGGPPVDSLFPDMPTHGIFNTYYGEIGFTFNPNNRANAYNVQTEAGIPVPNNSGTLLYHSFSVDVSNLSRGYAVHFDLYDELIRGKKNSVVFAPFSHDVEGPHYVPDGGMTLVFLGAAVAGLALFRRKLC